MEKLTVAVQPPYNVLLAKGLLPRAGSAAAEAVKDVKPGWEPDRYNTFWGRNRRR